MSAEQIAVIYLLVHIGALGLIVLGIFAMVVYRNLIRVILGLGLLDAGINLFLISLSYRPDAVAPIVSEGMTQPMVDPVPQALVLTAIVIGVSVQALALALAVRTYQAYGTLDSKVLAQKIAAETGTSMVEDQPVHLPPPLTQQPLLEKKS